MESSSLIVGGGVHTLAAGNHNRCDRPVPRSNARNPGTVRRRRSIRPYCSPVSEHSVPRLRHHHRRRFPTPTLPVGMHPMANGGPRACIPTPPFTRSARWLRGSPRFVIIDNEGRDHVPHRLPVEPVYTPAPVLRGGCFSIVDGDCGSTDRVDQDLAAITERRCAVLHRLVSSGCVPSTWSDSQLGWNRPPQNNIRIGVTDGARVATSCDQL